MTIEWEEMLAPYNQAVEELKVKLKGIRREYTRKNIHSPIEFVTGRVKTPESIAEKVRVRNLDKNHLETEVQDIGGLRVMCQFVEDIYDVVQLLRERQDFEIVTERDYILNKKASGYRSYHVVISYPVEKIDGIQHVLLEIQIRTLAMNFWATIEHSLNYKYAGDYPKTLHRRLERAAEAAFQLDKEMSEIREDIQIAQDYFKTNKG